MHLFLFKIGINMVSLVFDHIHLRSKSVELAAKFYESIFDAERLVEYPSGRIDIRLAGLKVIITTAIRNMDSGHGLAEAPLDHLAFEVEDLMALANSLKSIGVKFAEDVRSPKPGILTAFILAPDNVKIELIQRD